MIDMYSPYISLIKRLFQNVNIIIDKFHLINFISISLNKTRIKIMKYDKNLLYMKKSKCKLALTYSNFFIIILGYTHYLTKNSY